MYLVKSRTRRDEKGKTGAVIVEIKEQMRGWYRRSGNRRRKTQTWRHHLQGLNISKVEGRDGGWGGDKGEMLQVGMALKGNYR